MNKLDLFLVAGTIYFLLRSLEYLYWIITIIMPYKCEACDEWHWS